VQWNNKIIARHRRAIDRGAPDHQIAPYQVSALHAAMLVRASGSASVEARF
jgi:predicted RNA polymerase sigma factor